MLLVAVLYLERLFEAQNAFFQNQIELILYLKEITLLLSSRMIMCKRWECPTCIDSFCSAIQKLKPHLAATADRRCSMVNRTNVGKSGVSTLINYFHLLHVGTFHAWWLYKKREKSKSSGITVIANPCC